MTQLVNGVLVIEVQEPEKCELCGGIAECRPYGPKGEKVCFGCAMKDLPAARRAFLQRLNGGQ